jgi:bacteriocin-like protein
MSDLGVFSEPVHCCGNLSSDRSRAGDGHVNIDRRQPMKETVEMRDELSIDELNSVSGGQPSLGIAYGYGSDGKAQVSWGDVGGSWVIKEGQKTVTWVPA